MNLSPTGACSSRAILRPKVPITWVLLIITSILAATSFAGVSTGGVPTGDAQSATNYYHTLVTTLEFSTPDQIFQTKLDDVAAYLGYRGFTGADFQNLPPALLMNPNQLLSSQESVAILQHPDAVLASLGPIPFRPDDILATRFFAPKIMNINDPESIRQLGWRKLVRLKARVGSLAEKHHISYGIILFNFFTSPGVQPFSPTNESINTQVMLVTDLASVPPPNSEGPPSIYWLDYGPLSTGGTLSLALNASFDANQLPQSSNGKRNYFVPDGCIACHGANVQYSLVNYLDTDHWFDRLENDFPQLKASGIPLIFDAQTNDTTQLSFKTAFDVIRRFNAEADAEVSSAQPAHDEALASHKWLEIHATNDDHVQPIERAIGLEPRWSSQNSNDVQVLSAFNQYCFRCHGTVKFSVFNREEIRRPLNIALIDSVIRTNTSVLLQMPPDRPLPDSIRLLLHQFTQ